MLPQVGTRAADSFTPEDAGRLRDTLSRGYSASSVRLSLSFLAAVYSWAVKQNIVVKNPFVGVERPTTQPSIDYLSRDEVAALLRTASEQAAPGNHAHQQMACCASLALYTGLRKGELLGLRWQDLDLESRRLTVARSFKSSPKSGKVRHLRLPSNVSPG